MRQQATEATTGTLCTQCGAWRGELGQEPTPQLYVAHLTEIFREVRRVLADDGVLWLNLGDTYNSVAGNYRGLVQGMKKADAKITLGGGIERLKIKTYRYNRRPTKIEGLREKSLVGIPWRAALALQDDGWILRSECIWYKRSAMPESVTDRPNRDHEHVFLLAKQPRYFFDMDAVRIESSPVTLERDKYTRITKGKDGPYAVAHNHETPSDPNGRNLRTVWDITTRSYKGAHFAVFPPALPERCIKAGSREGDTVLDPFGGSGTTAYVAALLGRRAVSIDLNPDYGKLAAKRLAKVQKGFFGAYDIDDLMR